MAAGHSEPAWQQHLPTLITYCLAVLGLFSLAEHIYSSTVGGVNTTSMYARTEMRTAESVSTCSPCPACVSPAQAACSEQAQAAVAQAAPIFPASGQRLSDVLKASEFERLGLECVTDKVTRHHYAGAYEWYLWDKRDEPLKVCEIGLGCDMNYAAGHSLCLWRQYLPNAEFSVLEVNASCAASFASDVSQMYSGDQANMTLLAEIAAAGPYDVIVDDGGHSWRQQRNSFIGLLPAVKPEGIYVLEDLETSYWTDATLADAADGKSAAEMIKDVLDNLLDKEPKAGVSHPSAELAQLIDHVDCFHELCVFQRNANPSSAALAVGVDYTSTRS